MIDRHAKLKRLAAVQRQMERVADVELADIMRERALVADKIDALVSALASPAPVHANFSKLYGVQIGKLKIRDQILTGRMQLQQKKVISEKAKADRLDEVTAEALEVVEREKQDVELEQLLECIGAIDAQASRKFHRP